MRYFERFDTADPDYGNCRLRNVQTGEIVNTRDGVEHDDCYRWAHRADDDYPSSPGAQATVENGKVNPPLPQDLGTALVRTDPDSPTSASPITVTTTPLGSRTTTTSVEQSSTTTTRPTTPTTTTSAAATTPVPGP